MRFFRVSFLVASLMAVSCALAGPLNDLDIFGYDPKADAAAIIVSGNARFTILSEFVIRCEYSSTATFEDRATIAIVNRKRPVPTFTHNTASGVLTIATASVTLSYTVGTAFSASTLSGKSGNGAAWHYGKQDTGNLFGTIKSLDELCTISLNCTKNAGTIIHHEQLHCAWGVVSQLGWTTIDDTKNYIMSNHTDGWFNNTDRSVSDVDLYFFGHGLEFKQAVYDYTRLSGAQQMFDRPMLGSWFTRWYDYDNDDIQRLLDIFERTSLPLDVLVLDMNWHTKNAWTGYSWDKQVFPIPQDTMDLVHSRGLIAACNIHDAEGIGVWEDEYNGMCKAMGQNPAAKQTVAFQPLNHTYMHALDDIVLKATGFDFWWIDWQQGGQVGGCNGGRMNPTIITDHVRGTDNIRRGANKRDNILARWGGLGSQRYPVGFSGDVQQLDWTCFAFQPYFSVTAANVGYGHISNDLVGPPHDHELHVRWMQFGAFSGVMRIHDRGMSAGSCWESDDCAIVNLWRLPFKYFEAIREVMTLRVSLLPYMYTMVRNAYDTGLTMVHPLYYEWPSHQSAYGMGPGGTNAQYMFGDDIMVAPITAAADSTTGLASRTIWVPPGQWYDEIFGQLITGDTDRTESYTLYDVPRYVRAGAIIPRLPNAAKQGIASRNYEALDYYIYPGTKENSRTLYEDDGKSHGYVRNEYATSTIYYNRSTSADSITVTISAPTGSYTGMPTARAMRVVLVGSVPLSAATCNGQAVQYSRFGTGESSSTTGYYNYDGKLGQAIIDCKSVTLSSGLVVTASFAFADSTPSVINRVRLYGQRAQLAKRMIDDTRETPYSVSIGPGMTKQAAAHAGLLTYLAGKNSSEFQGKVGSFYASLVTAAYAELTGGPGTPAPAQPNSELLQLWSASRQDMVLCGSEGCLIDNSDYQVMWVEGYQAPATAASRKPFNDFWSSSYSDNWGDTFDTAPNGYTKAIFSNGYIYGSQVSGSSCLQLWENTDTNDHMTLSSRVGEEWAQHHGYTRLSKCIGYATAEPPVESSSTYPGMAAFLKAQKEGKPFLAKDLLKAPTTEEDLIAAVTSTNTKKQQKKTKAKGGKRNKLGYGSPDQAMSEAQAIFKSILPTA